MTTPEEFGDIILRTEEGGKILRLKDVARIELGSSSYNVTSKLKGQPSAAIAIYQLPGSNSLEVAKGVREKMEQLAANLPEGVVYDVTLDTTPSNQCLHRRSARHLPGNNSSRHTGNLPVPPEFPCRHHPLYHHPRLSDRDTGGHVGLGVFDQYVDFVRVDPGYRDRGG